MGEWISVIVPVYNAGDTLCACLESICQNSYRNLQIILVDDGSTDHSGAICDRFAAEDERVEVIHQQKNGGVSKARNAGLAAARGAYVAFVDSDDTVAQACFSQLLAVSEETNADLAIGAVDFSKSGAANTAEQGDATVSLWQPSADDRRHFYMLNRAFLLYGPVAKLYKRELILSGKVQFPEDTSYGEDLLFNFAYLAQCKTVTYKNVAVYYCDEDNAESLSRRYRTDVFENGLRLNGAIVDFGSRSGLLTPELEAYCAARVVGDAYNGIFAAWDRRSGLNIWEKYRRTREVMHHPAVRLAYEKWPQERNDNRYWRMIGKKQALLFSLIRCVRGVGVRRREK